jgi:hypothetical protein
MPSVKPTDLKLTDSQVEEAEAKATKFLKDNENDWPFVYAILAELGCADGLGGAEYRRRTRELLTEKREEPG